jgi:hypothetical protein
MAKTAQQKRSDKAYAARPEQIQNRVERNTARRRAMAAGLVHKGDGKEIDHKTPLIKGGSNAKSNQRIIDAEKNRAWRRGKSGKALPD